MEDSQPSNALGVAGLAMTAFNMFMPNIKDLRKNMPNSEVGDDARVGELVSAAVTTGMGVIASAISNRKWPLWVAIAVAVLFVLIHEFVLQSPPIQTRTDTQ